MHSSTMPAPPVHPTPVVDSPLRKAARIALWALWVVALILGCAGVYQRILYGHLPAGYGSYVPWGLWVALYFHGVGLAGGAFAIGAGGYVLGLPGFRSRRVLRTVIVLSAATILPSFLGVWFDLGHMERAHFIFTRPAFTSMMTLNAWMYYVFLFVAAGCFFISFRRDDRGWLNPLLCLGILLSVLFPSQSGAFFGVVEAKPFWNSPLLPILFLTSAITAGSALLLCVRWLLAADDAETAVALGRLRGIVLGGLGVYFLLEFAEISLTVWNPQAHSAAIDLLLWGEYWWVFWMVHLALGGILAFVLLAVRSRVAWVGGAFLVAVTFVSSRLNVLLPGQAVGELVGLQEAFYHPRLKHIYHASLNEYMVGFFMLATGMMVFYLGRAITQTLERTTSANKGE